jgi:excisionase family DNA binding protein
MSGKMSEAAKAGEVCREFWTLDQVAQRLGVHTFTIRRLCWAGKLRVTRIGAAQRISEGELQRFITQHTNPSPPGAAAAETAPAHEVRQ